MNRAVNVLINTSLIIGVFIIIGAIGNDDSMVFSGIKYPLISTLKVIAIGFVMTVPAIVRGVYGEKQS